MDLRAELADWPVGSASAAVIGPDGVLDLVDDGQRYPWASVTKVLTAIDRAGRHLRGRHRARRPGRTARVDPAASAVPRVRAGDRLRPDPGPAGHPPGVLESRHRAGRRAPGEPHRPAVRRRIVRTGAGPAGHDRYRADRAAGARRTWPDRRPRGAGRRPAAPTLLLPKVVELASTVAFPGLGGVLPGFGRQEPNDWGLGCEIRDHKQPHWTAPDNSPATFGHFGQSGSFIWVDPAAQLACVSLSDTAFGPWAAERWPRLSAAVLQAYATLTPR